MAIAVPQYFMNTFTIHKAQPKDAQGIQDVLLLAWLQTYPNEHLGVTKEIIRNFLKRSTTKAVAEKIGALSETEKYHVAKIRESDVIVGFARTIGDELRALYVHPVYQGKGVGTSLFNSFVQVPERVRVAQYNRKAIGFYEKLGFKGRKPVTAFNLEGILVPQFELVLELASAEPPRDPREYPLHTGG